VFVVHGDDDACTAFTECLRVEYGHRAYAPYSGSVFNLISNKFEFKAEPILLKKKAQPASGAYARLLAAGQRLLVIIKKHEHGANKDLSKMADQIIALCDKFER